MNKQSVQTTESGTAPFRSWWSPDRSSSLFQTPSDVLAVVNQPRDSVRIVRLDTGHLAVAVAGEIYDAPVRKSDADRELVGSLPGLYPEWLGDRSFAEVHGARFPYVVGEMAQGIATARMVIEAAGNGLMSFFGSAGLSPQEIDEAVHQIADALGPAAVSWGANLIHSPNQPAAEDAVVDVLLRRRVHRVSASAFMEMAPSIVRYMATGLSRDDSGRIHRRNHVFAKVSRPEVARHFLSPPDEAMLRDLVGAGKLSPVEAELAAQLPVAGDLTAEADSGGHTDNRPLAALFPTLLGLRDEMASTFGYATPIRVGAAGGLGTPGAVASAFALGAAYVLTGSINQSAVESGLSAAGRELLCRADLADVAMAPAADMFELGVKVQVLKRGTLFAPRAQNLYDLYRRYDDLDQIPAADRKRLETQVFRATIDEVWARTREFFAANDPAQVERAERTPKHKMSLVFRWYLFMGAKWARDGQPERLADYQIWCGPAMGAYNAWCRGSVLEAPENRSVVMIARNLLEGAAVITRAQQLRSFGFPVPAAAFQFHPRQIG